MFKLFEIIVKILRFYYTSSCFQLKSLFWDPDLLRLVVAGYPIMTSKIIT